MPKGTKYQYINQDVLLSGRVSVRNGKILLDNNKEYQTIIIRDEALDLSTMQQLEAMAKAGAQVVGVKPLRTLRLLHRAEEGIDSIGRGAFMSAVKDFREGLWSGMKSRCRNK